MEDRGREDVRETGWKTEEEQEGKVHSRGLTSCMDQTFEMSRSIEYHEPKVREWERKSWKLSRRKKKEGKEERDTEERREGERE